MITLEKKAETVEDYLLNILAPMGEVSIKDGNFYKNDKKFGLLRDNEVYLLIESGEFAQVDDYIVEKRDEFLQLATKSYWLASGKI